MARSIRFKKDSVCDSWQETSQGGYECAGYGEIEVPIQDWKFFPEYINSVYIPGDTIKNIDLSIALPELDLWLGRSYKNVHFEISVLYQGEVSDWLDISSSGLVNGQFTGANIRSAKVSLNLKNLVHLGAGIHTASIVVKAYEVINGQRNFIEQCPEPVKFVLNVKEGKAIQNPDFRERKITYNLDTQKYTGDLEFTINAPEAIYSHLGISPDPYKFHYDIVEWGTQSRKLRLRESNHSIVKSMYPKGVYRKSIILYNRDYKQHAEIPLIVTIIDNETLRDFSVVPTEFDLVVSKTNNEIKIAKANIYNPQDLEISVKLSPSFLDDVKVENNQLKFQTMDLTDIALGKYSGEIILVSGTLEKRVKVNLKVIQSLVSDFRRGTYYFALDKNKISLSRTTPAASYITLKLEMYFKGYGRELMETQDYSYPYFRDEIELYPGEEVQDFFIRCKELTEDNVWTLFDEQYNLALVNITIKEFDIEDRELSESQLNNIFFAPGRRPKCYPFFTDFGKRRVFENSKIRLNTDVLFENKALSGLFKQYNESISEYKKGHKVVAFNLDNDRFAGAKKTIVRAGDLEFIPFPKPKGGKVIHLFFENQNLVLDWFTCPAHHHRKFDFHHITDELTGEKFGALETENFIINTGWILKEEIELINALLKSRICFIVIGTDIIKARPIGRKNEMYDTTQNLYSMDLEFNIKQNER